ncbi:MAG: nuclear transport factor 2 family protein [Cyanobacteria bacterium J06623_4]
MTDKFIASSENRAKIIEVVNRYGLAIDLHDWEGFRSLFVNPVEFDYSSIGVAAGSLQPDEIVNTARQDLSGFRATQHLITNHIVEILDDSATCLAHVRAMHFLPNDQGDNTFEMGGYYTSELVCSESDWKIQRWKFSVLWSSGNHDLFRLAKGA